MIYKLFRYCSLIGLVVGSSLHHSTASAQSRFIQLDHGGDIICALRDDNVAFCNSLLNPEGRTPADLPPTQKIAATRSTACALLTTGELSCFGTGAFGLDNPPTAGAPYQDVSMSFSHACAINSSNGLECWGIDSNNRLDAPTGEFVQVSVSTQNACAVDLNGGVSCWGANDQGSIDVPADLPAATKVVAGFASSCALLNDGNVQCWGRPLESLTGPYVDFDMIASGNFERGNSAICATDAQGAVDCRYFSNEEDLSVEITDQSQPQGIGNSSVSLPFNRSGCYINDGGTIECFGIAPQTNPPTLDGGGSLVSVADDTTGLRSLVYSGTAIELFWDAPPDAFNVAGHEIRRNGEVVEFTQNLSSFFLTDLKPNETETFAVRRINVSGAIGPFSDTITVTPINGQPDLPPTPSSYVPPERQFEESFVGAFLFCESDVGELFWFADTDTPDIDGFEIHRDGQFIAFVEGDFYDDNEIQPGVEHIYDVIAIDLDDPTRFHGVASTVLDISDADSGICL